MRVHKRTIEQLSARRKLPGDSQRTPDTGDRSLFCFSGESPSPPWPHCSLEKKRASFRLKSCLLSIPSNPGSQYSFKYITKLIYQQLYPLSTLPLLLWRDVSSVLCPSQWMATESSPERSWMGILLKENWSWSLDTEHSAHFPLSCCQENGHSWNYTVSLQ